jgi:hypothetical protein
MPTLTTAACAANAPRQFKPDFLAKLPEPTATGRRHKLFGSTGGEVYNAFFGDTSQDGAHLFNTSLRGSEPQSQAELFAPRSEQ